MASCSQFFSAFSCSIEGLWIGLCTAVTLQVGLLVRRFGSFINRGLANRASDLHDTPETHIYNSVPHGDEGSLLNVPVF